VVFCDPIEVVSDDGRVHARAVDVSIGGIAVEGDELEPGAQVRVRFSLGHPTRRVDSRARVVRHVDGTTALRFEQMAWLARANLQDYVTAVRRGTSYPPPVWH
jgi:hypothetical protein